MTNIQSEQANQARSFIESAQDVLIVLPKRPSFDAVASGLAFFLALSSKGKRVYIACPDQMTVEYNRLVGVDKITDSINGGSGKNLVISFPYQEGSIEKVSYNIENETFNLVVEPREGYPIVTPEMMRYSYSGGNTDVIICVGGSSLSDFDSIFNNNQGVFAEKPTVNIDINPQNNRFGKVNIVDPNSSSIAEITVSLFSIFGFTLDADNATNLYAGIASGSTNFTSNQTNAGTFENAAICMRHNARKVNIPSVPSQNTTSENKTDPSFETFVKQPQKPTYQQAPVQPRQTPNNSRPTPMMPQVRNNPPFMQKPVQSQQTPPVAQKPPSQSSDAPPDWLKPKIYKGSTLL